MHHHRLRTAFCVLVLAAVHAAFGTPAAAQAPGYPPVDPRMIMAQYQAEVLDHVNRLMARWGKAWGDDDAKDVADLYWENAVLIPPGDEPLRGRDAIRQNLEKRLPEEGQLEAFMLDFDASGGMAVVYGNYQLTEGGETRSGPMMTVFLQRGKTWKIRSQVFSAN